MILSNHSVPVHFGLDGRGPIQELKNACPGIDATNDGCLGKHCQDLLL